MTSALLRFNARIEWMIKKKKKIQKLEYMGNKRKDDKWKKKEIDEKKINADEEENWLVVVGMIS